MMRISIFIIVVSCLSYKTSKSSQDENISAQQPDKIELNDEIQVYQDSQYVYLEFSNRRISKKKILGNLEEHGLELLEMIETKRSDLRHIRYWEIKKERRSPFAISIIDEIAYLAKDGNRRAEEYLLKYFELLFDEAIKRDKSLPKINDSHHDLFHLLDPRGILRSFNRIPPSSKKMELVLSLFGIETEYWVTEGPDSYRNYGDYVVLRIFQDNICEPVLEELDYKRVLETPLKVTETIELYISDNYKLCERASWRKKQLSWYGLY